MMNLLQGIVTDEDFSCWLNQFDEADRAFIRKLLPHYQFFNSDMIFEMLGKLYNMLVNDYHIDVNATLFVPIGYAAKSGNAITYFFKRQNDLEEKRFILLNDLNEDHLLAVKYVVFIDDFIGSGESLEKLCVDFIDKLTNEVKNRITSSVLVLLDMNKE